MSEGSFTRRTFLAGVAGVSALAGLPGLVGCASSAPSVAGEAKTAHALCAGCSNRCGYTAYVVGGAVTKVIADDHPAARGKLCSEGYGVVYREASGEGRIAKPLKRTSAGSYEEVSWDDAIADIAEKVKAAVGQSGPDAVALVHNGRPTGSYYGSQFIGAFGSANVYSMGDMPNLSRMSGYAQVIGSDAVSDFARARAVLLLGSSALDALSPAETAALQAARGNGAEVLVASPRLDNAAALATNWFPIKPGTELALVLGVAGAVVRNGLYDARYVSGNAEGFEGWRSYVLGCTSEWASKICGVPAAEIEGMASALATAAPAASVSLGNATAAFRGCGNVGELARATAMLNTLLGCWNEPGGARLVPLAGSSPWAIADGVQPAAAGEPYGAKQYPLAVRPSAFAAIEGMNDGSIKCAFFCDADVTDVCPDPSQALQAIEKLDLSVAIASRKSPMTGAVHYVLPDYGALEQAELPDYIAGEQPAVAVGASVIEPLCPDALPIDQIFEKLAEACGVGMQLGGSFETVAEAQLKSVGLSLPAALSAGTCYVEVPASASAAPIWNTPSGKIQFASKACEAAGLTAFPKWSEGEGEGSDDRLCIVRGPLPSLRTADSCEAAPLSAMAEQYGLDCIWISPADAAKRGLADGDVAEVKGDQASGRVRVKVTERVMAGAAFLPDYPALPVDGVRKGSAAWPSVPYAADLAYGGLSVPRTLVAVRKAGV